jgi:WD40 repeat protein
MPIKPIIFLAFANDKVDNTRYLRNLPLEMDGVRRALYEAEDAGLCEILERANATIENILDVFQDNRYKDRIAVFHYGGHADGYQLLLEQLDGSHSIAHGGGLVSFLAKQKGLKLIFFNGCSTQQQSQELVEAGVPIVIGTSQAISDDVATSLSIRFYGGLANGASIERAWLEAIDYVKIQKGSDSVRGLYRKSEVKATEDRFPWEMYVRTGAELIKEWNLPEAVENPLFGLPEIPANYDLPDEPFMFLGRYERRHAEVFFGRSYYIRDLYNRISSKNSAPVILLYGQSGVGKSSLLDAGLLPRLEGEYQVTYVRRNRALGLSGTLKEALDFKEKTSYQNGHTAQNQIDNLLNTNGSFLKTLEQVAQLESIALHADGALKVELLAVINRFKRQHEEVFSQEAKRHKYEQAKAVAKDIKDLRQKRKGNAIFNEKRFQKIEEEIETGHNDSLLSFWKAKEKKAGKPVVIILDQVEEVFTQPNMALPDELELFLADLDSIFKNPQNRPRGKLILSYRKEYHPEIEELLKIQAIPRENIFLTHLDKKDIADVVTGLTRTEKLRKKYRLEIQENLPAIIADDLLEDKDSSIAPVLQILLTKMWNMIVQDDYRVFSVDRYQELRREGVLLGDFFHQQMGKLRSWNPQIEQTGLALDLLSFHTTNLGTADTRSLEEIENRYGNRTEVLDLLLVCKDLYLLTNRTETITGLAHDTLAPLIQNEYKNSDRSGQRAARILESKVVDFVDNKKILLDETDLNLVEAGQKGMRVWTEDETRLIELSRKRRNRKVFLRRVLFFSIFIVTGVIAILGIFAMNEREKAEMRREDAERMKEIADYQKQKALQARDSFQVQRLRAEQATELAILEQERAEAAAALAKKQEQIARDSAESARKQRVEAEKASRESQISATLANDAAFQAEIKSRQAEKQNVESKLGEFKAKAKELAILSIAQIENIDLKNRLALAAYQMEKNGLQNTIKSINDIRTRYEDTVYFKPNQRRIPIYRRNYGNLLTFQDLLNYQVSVNKTSSEVFYALRQAFIAQQKDYLYENTESWAMAITKDNELIFNNQDEGINKALLFPSSEGLPRLKGVEKLSIGSKRSSPRSIIVTEEKIYCSTQDGQIVAWNASNPATKETLVNQSASILTMVHSKNANALFYAIQGSIYQYDLKRRTNQPILQQASSIRQLVIIENENQSYLIFADEQGSIIALNLDDPNKQSKIIYQQTNKGGIYALTYIPRQKWLVAGDVNGRLIVLWEISIENLQKNDFSAKFAIEKKHKGIVRTIVVSPDNQYAASGSWDGTVLLWKMEDIKVENLINEPLLSIQNESKILSLLFDKTSNYLLIADEKNIRICPTQPYIFYQKICDITKQQEETKEWKDFYSREENKIIREECRCVRCE